MRKTQEIIDALRVEAPMVFNTLYGDTMREAADRLEQLEAENINWATKRSATIDALQKELETAKEGADRLEQLLAKSKNKEAISLIEDVLDTLVEVGNGVTDEMLHEAAEKLFKVRALLKGGQNNGI
jgi:hypothetical protein